MTKTIAIDFDGVIHAYSRGWQDGSIYDEPIPGALDGIRELMEHCAVFVHTTRNDMLVAEWLCGHGLPAISESPWVDKPEFWNDQTRVLVTNRKLPAVAYLDDRAVRFHAWPSAMVDLLMVLDGKKL